MSGSSVLFDTPGPKAVVRHRIYTVVTVLVVIGLIAFAVMRLYEEGQLEYALWEPFLTPEYVSALLVDGLLDTLKMAFSAIIGAVVFGPGLRHRQAERAPAAALAELALRGVLPRRARCC